MSQIDNKYKRLMVDHPHIVRKAQLSDSQIRVFRAVEKLGDATSRDVADQLCWSVQQAGGMLHRLWKKGYCTRIAAQDPTGGVIFIYRSGLLGEEVKRGRS